MKVSRRHLLASAAAAAGTWPFTASAEATVTPAMDDAAVAARVDDYLIRLSGFGYSGAALLARGDRVLVRKGYGMANDEARIPVVPDTVFDIASLTKPLTATAALTLVAEGRLDLQDTLGRRLPNVPSDKQAITVEQLLSNTSGLARDFPYQPEGADYEEIGKEEALRRILASEMAGAPGETYVYSNMGYMLAAAVIEAAAGQPYRDVMRARVLGPAGMANSGFWGVDVAAVPDARLAYSYDDGVRSLGLRDRSETTWADRGGGQMISTVDDLHRFMRALLDGRILPTALRERMWTPGKGDYGLGWTKRPLAGAMRINHGGNYIGYGSELAYFPEHDMIQVNLANRQRELLGTRFAADRIVPQVALGKTPVLFPGRVFDMPPRWSPEASAELTGMVGLYRTADGAEFKVARDAAGTYSIAAKGQAAIDAVQPGTADDLAARAESNPRALALIRAAIASDLGVMQGILREGAPVEMYRDGIRRTAVESDKGDLISMELVGTSPFATPIGGRSTVVRLQYARGQEHLRFGWDPAQNRIIWWGTEAPGHLGQTILRDGAEGGIVGWDIVNCRQINVAAVKGDGGGINGIEVWGLEGTRTPARRAADA